MRLRTRIVKQSVNLWRWGWHKRFFSDILSWFSMLINVLFKVTTRQIWWWGRRLILGLVPKWIVTCWLIKLQRPWANFWTIKLRLSFGMMVSRRKTFLSLVYFLLIYLLFVIEFLIFLMFFRIIYRGVYSLIIWFIILAYLILSSL
jgi:hypothetical protein